ncbi:MAG: hypothetical protein ABMB14_32565 [Myxococcota bacterium]
MRWFMVVVLAGGCAVGSDPLDGGQFGEESGARCEVATRTPLGRDEASALGFSPADVLAYAEGTHAATLAYTAGGSTGLTVEVAQTGALEYLEQHVVSGDGGGGAQTEAALFCPNVVSLGVTLGFATDDGAFAESWEVALLAEAADRVTLYQDLDAVAGTFDVWDHAPDPNDFDDATAWLELALDAAGATGIVHGQGSGTDGDVAFAQNFDVATFAP